MTVLPEEQNTSGVEEHHLLWMKDKLLKVHHEYYRRVDAGEKDVDVTVCFICQFCCCQIVYHFDIV